MRLGKWIGCFKFTLLSAVLSGGCGNLPPINPPQPPPSCPATCPEGQECTDPAKGCVDKPVPPPECLPGVPWCSDLVPPATCGNCKHNPTSDPAHCEMAPACPVEPPPVEPPPPGECPLDESKLVGLQGIKPVMGEPVNKAITALGDTKGQDPHAVLEKLAAQIRSYGECAAAGQEAVFILRPDSLWEEYHAVYFGNGSLIPGGKYMYTHRLTGTKPEPTGCTAPLPDRAKLKIKLECKDVKGNPRCDATVTTVGTCTYCESLGMGETAPGVPRCGCPVRNECPGVKCGEREACEAYAMANAYVWQSLPGGRVIQNPDNPALATCYGCDQVRVCAGDGLFCSPWVTP